MPRVRYRDEGGKTGGAEVKRAWAVALALTCWMAGARAEDDSFVRYGCGTVTCSIVKDDLRMLLKSNDEWYARMKAAEEKLEKSPPKCAETTVTEPSKNPAPAIVIPKEKTL